MSKIVAFARVSTAQQDLAQHKESLLTYAEKTLGYQKKDVIFIGEKESGLNNEADRRTLDELWEVLDKEPKVDAVLTFEISRIARRPAITFSVRDRLKARHIQIYIMNPSIKCFTPEFEVDFNAALVFSIYAQLAEQEATLLRERSMRGKEKKMAQGVWVSRIVPFGYTLDKSQHLVVDEAQAEIVREIFHLRAQGLTPKKIEAELKATGRPMKWSHINSILVNQGYTGVPFKRADGRNEFTAPAIITEEEWNKAREGARMNVSVKEGKHSRFYVGRRLLYCAHCGNLMAINKCRGTLYYACRKRLRHDIQTESCDNKSTILASVIDNLIWSETKKLYSIRLLSDSAKSIGDLERAIARLAVKIDSVDPQLAKVERGLQRARKLFVNDELSDAEYNEMREQLNSQRATIKQQSDQYRLERESAKRQIERLRNSAGSTYEQKLALVKEVDQLDDVQKKSELASEFFSRITIGMLDGTKHREVIFYEKTGAVSKFKIEWRTGKVWATYSSVIDQNGNEVVVFKDMEIDYDMVSRMVDLAKMKQELDEAVK